MKKLQDVLQFEEDPEPHWPISFVLDNSIPMGIDDKIGILNRALVEFKEDMSTDPVALTRAEISVVTFDQEVTWLDFRPLDEFEPPELTTQGEARLSPAINTALDLMERRKQAYREAGVSYYRPWFRWSPVANGVIHKRICPWSGNALSSVKSAGACVFAPLALRTMISRPYH